MKKTVFLAALIIFLMMAGLLPWLVGMSFKQRYIDFVAAINQKNTVKVTILNYHQGWLSSTATLQITPIVSPASALLNRTPALSPEQMAAFTTFTLNQTIAHGPIVMDKVKHHPTLAMGTVTSLFHSPIVEKMLYGEVKPRGLIQIESLLNFSNDCFNHVTIAAFQYGVPGMGTINWQGLITDILVHLTPQNDFNKVNSMMKFGSLTVKSESSAWPIDFSAQPISMSSDTEKHAIGLWTGSSELILPGAMLNNAAAPIFNFSNLLFVNRAALLEKNLYQFSGTITLGQLTVPSWPINSISGLSFKTTITGLNAGELSNLKKIVNALQDTSREEFDKQYVDALVRILTPATKLDVALITDTSLGKANINGLLYWPSGLPSPKSADEVIANTNANIDIRISMPLAKKLIEMAANNMAERSARPVTMSSPAIPLAADSRASDAKTAFSEVVADLLRNGKITLPISLQILSWWDQQLPAAAFETNIKQFRLSTDTENSLIKNYVELKKGVPAQITSSSQVITPNPQTPQQMQEQMQQMLVGNITQTIDEAIKQGYILQDGNDYVATIKREGGVMKVNGKDLPTMVPQPGLGVGPVIPQS